MCYCGISVLVGIAMKTCSDCGKIKEEDRFQIRVASKDGLTAACKRCLSQRDKKRANLPHRIKARKEYAKTPEGLIAGNKAKKAWEGRNAIKKGASTIVGNAVRDGVITKQYFCSVCGIDNVRIHGHHDDYAQPLTVRWLCSQCHNDWHSKNGEG